ncbi:MAG: hypothetical protein H7Y13_09015 [Sphingobacteriaceae bacterium]|nr:hypothetical protein [Sphingobacteriaceae bacterium]
MEHRVIDIEDTNEILEKTDKLIHGLDAGIQAVSMDFGFHIKDTFAEPKIFDIRNNISYRLSSSRFHFRLLFTQLSDIHSKHANLDRSTNFTDSSQWHLEIDKKHISYLLDSIVFHLSSVFDYSAILINYILVKTDDTPNWNKIESHARGKSGLFSNEKSNDVKKSVIEIHNNFVRQLYDYRSDIIHRTSDVLNAHFAHELASNKKTILFLCSKMQQKKFKDIQGLENKYTVTYFVHHLITKTIEAIANILRVLRNYMEENSDSKRLLKEGKLMFAYIGENKETVSPGLMYWGEFDRAFQEQSE